MIESIKREWFSSPREEILAGITTTMAIIPGTIAFSFIAGVNPMVGFYSSICILILIALTGGRPGMVSATAGSMVVLMTDLVANHGIEYMIGATILTGIIQYLMGVLKLSWLMRIVPHSVIVGFVNALAVLIILSQLTYFTGESWPMYVIAAISLALIYIIPRLTKVIPSPLIAVIVLTLVCVFFRIPIQSVGDIVTINGGLPTIQLANLPYTFSAFLIIIPYALSLSVVGYTETLLTVRIIDDLTQTESNPDKEMRGQGFSNLISGIFGGMAGCALIAESAMNVKVGGKGRLSVMVSGLFLLLLILVMGSVVSLIPIAVLVGVMLMLSAEIFDWRYLRKLRTIPKKDTVIMLTTMGVAIPTQDLAIGVLAGVILNALISLFGRSKLVSGDM